MTNSFDIRIAPNPFQMKTEIKVKMPLGYQSVKLKLFNTTGILLQQFDINHINDTIILNGDGLANGLYYYSLVNNGLCMRFGKIIKL